MKVQKDFLNKDELKKCSLSIICFARLIDIVLVSLIQVGLYFLFINLLRNENKMIIAFSLLGTNFFVIFFYFIFLPYFLKGRTLVKLMFRIVIYKKDLKRLSFLNICYREFIFIFIPWSIYFIGLVIGTAILYTNENTDPDKMANILMIVIRVSISFSFVWVTVLAITIYFQAEHRSWIDIRQDIYVMQRIRLKNKNIDTKKSTVQGPAVIDPDELNEFLKGGKD